MDFARESQGLGCYGGRGNDEFGERKHMLRDDGTGFERDEHFFRTGGRFVMIGKLYLGSIPIRLSNASVGA